MKILVTGGAGFIGSHVVEEFQDKAEVVVLDNFKTGKLDNIKNFKHLLIRGDINDRDVVRSALKGVDYVFHMAAMVSVVESMERPAEYTKVNTVGTLTVLEEAARARVKKLCFCSSSAIYGENPETPKHEGMKPEPLSPYAITKLDGEHYCEMFSRFDRLKTACLRFFNVFGPRQDPKSQYAAAIPIFVSNAVNNNPITIYGDGEQTRDFVYVKDVVAANFHMAMGNFNGVFNVGYGRKTTINDLVSKIIKMTSSKSEIKYAPPRQGEIRESIASIDKILSTGFRPSHDFDEGLSATIKFFMAKKR
ncbi:MAG TPA: NAD-dependent epimerase/dehydratase family protein [Victivallales bacterium]|nr:NAD-dependent epimerase/dehydratase family protein [Victivallales bacterium]